MNASPEGPGRTPARARSQPSFLPRLGFILALATLLLAGVEWNNLRRNESAETAELALLGQRLTALEEGAARKNELSAESAGTREALKSMNDRLDSLDASLADLRKRSEEGRDAWIKAEAASLLVAANEQTQIRADPVLAVRALTEADERLKLLSDARLIPVRQEITREANLLRAVPQPDTVGMTAALSALAGSVDKLPLKRTAPDHYTPDSDAPAVPAAAKPGLWERFKASIARLVHDMFTLRRHSEPVEPLLEPREEYFLRRNLELRLDSARAALLERDDATFQDSVRGAALWLNTYFDGRDTAVKAAVQQLDGMQQLSIAPKLPDISYSLTLLRQLETPRVGAP
ncbi:MAG TPA: uroporphyrinogen-III C-methyltransferase [Gammaproteobacteria bacterium]|nr:uroporphyrinogen-III C-methyltransferase [Gammaproteobacteria bacterium]